VCTIHCEQCSTLGVLFHTITPLTYHCCPLPLMPEGRGSGPVLLMGPNLLSLRGKRQRGTVFCDGMNSASIVEHCLSGTVHREYCNKSLLTVYDIYILFTGYCNNQSASFILNQTTEIGRKSKALFCYAFSAKIR
jgi:hypothetical protein